MWLKSNCFYNILRRNLSTVDIKELHKRLEPNPNLLLGRQITLIVGLQTLCLSNRKNKEDAASAFGATGFF